MTAATVLFGAAMAGINRVAGAKAGQSSKHLSGESAELTEATTDILGNAKFYRASGLKDAAMSRARAGFERWTQLVISVQRWPPRTRLIFELGGIVFIVGFLASTRLVQGGSPVTSLVFLALFYRLAPKLQQTQQGLLGARAQSSWWITWHQRYSSAEASRERPSGGLFPESLPSIVFEHVSYAFPGAESPALSDISWELPPGGCLAIVGESGGGKTTLLDLVLGVLTPSAGRIRLNQHDLATVDHEKWRRQIGFVMQDAPIFFGTLFENVTWGEAHPDRERAVRAVKLAHLSSLIETLPAGIDTELGHRGARLSGGQRQRVALARALYRNPWLLILDEATSALDSDSESVVQEALASLRGSCSILVVAHRIKTVGLADRILVISGGHVVEDGSWSTLMAAGGVFKRLAMAQGIEPGGAQ